MKKILVIGPRNRIEEFQQLELQDAEVSYLDQFYLDYERMTIALEEIPSPEDEFFIDNPEPGSYDIIIDLALDRHSKNLDWYVENEVKMVIGCAVVKSLGEIVNEMAFDMEGLALFGMNALPTFINRKRLELSVYDGKQEQLEKAMEALGIDYEVVEDRVGMVTPRIICMIINEACFVLQEGTADVPAVDQAMKLGTNYPMGPFEWAEKMGIENVYAVVEALRNETGDGKYKMAPLLKSYHLKDKLFYPG